MPLRFLLTCALQCVVLISFAQSDAYTLRRDSILRSPKMQVRLRSDSMKCTEEYFIRRNGVRIKMETEDGLSDSVFYNLWGAPVYEARYIKGKLYWAYAYTYNVFGDLFTMKGTFYEEDGSVSDIYDHAYEYKILPGGNEEVLTKIIDYDRRFDQGELLTTDSGYTSFEYDRGNQLIRQIEVGRAVSCYQAGRYYKKITAFEYNAKGIKTRQHSVKSGSCESDQTQEIEFEYNTQGMVISNRVFLNGELNEEIALSRDSTGHIVRYFKRDYSYSRIYMSDRTYYDNGLLKQTKIVYQGADGLKTYAYIYYP